MRRAFLVAFALTGCAHDATLGGGSHGIVSYGGGGGGYSSSASSSSSSSSYGGGAPEGHGASTSAEVHRSSAAGAPIAAKTSAAAELKQTDGKAGGAHAENKRLNAGLITLGVGYASTVVIGQVIDNTLIGDFEAYVGAHEVISRLWIPVLGPWSAIIYNETTVADNCSSPATAMMFPYTSCNLLHPSSLFILVGATAQTIGFAMTLSGLLRPPAPSAKHEKQLVLVPQGGPTSAGLTLTGSF